MAEESLSRKVVFSVIDRLIIGVVATLVVLFFNARYDEYQRVREEKIAVAKVHTEILLQLRQEFIRKMEKYFSLTVPLVKIKPDLRELSSLNDMTLGIENVLFNMLIVDDSLGPASTPLTADIQKLNGWAISLSSASGEVRDSLENIMAGGIDDLRKKYGRFILAVRRSCIRGIERDLSASAD